MSQFTGYLMKDIPKAAEKIQTFTGRINIFI